MEVAHDIESEALHDEVVSFEALDVEFQMPEGVVQKTDGALGESHGQEGLIVPTRQGLGEQGQGTISHGGKEKGTRPSGLVFRGERGTGGVHWKRKDRRHGMGQGQKKAGGEDGLGIEQSRAFANELPRLGVIEGQAMKKSGAPFLLTAMRGGAQHGNGGSASLGFHEVELLFVDVETEDAHGFTLS